MNTKALMFASIVGMTLSPSCSAGQEINDLPKCVTAAAVQCSNASSRTLSHGFKISASNSCLSRIYYKYEVKVNDFSSTTKVISAFLDPGGAQVECRDYAETTTTILEVSQKLSDGSVDSSPQFGDDGKRKSITEKSPEVVKLLKPISLCSGQVIIDRALYVKANQMLSVKISIGLDKSITMVDHIEAIDRLLSGNPEQPTAISPVNAGQLEYMLTRAFSENCDALKLSKSEADAATIFGSIVRQYATRILKWGDPEYGKIQLNNKCCGVRN